MPYSENNELPKTVTNVLSDHAQDIYRNAFNRAWDDYEDPSDRPEDESREDSAHNKAWGAVKTAADKGNSNNWDLNQASGFTLIGLIVLVFSLAATFLYLQSKNAKIS